MIFNLDAMVNAMSKSTFEDSDVELWKDAMKAKVEHQKNNLSFNRPLSQSLQIEGLGASGSGVVLDGDPSMGFLGGTIGYTATGVQSVIDKYAHGSAPVTAADFFKVSGATGVPIDLMLAQAIAESNIGTNGSRTLATQNIYNVGNVDNGSNRSMGGWVAGMYTYAKLIREHYAPDPDNITAENVILPQFVVRRGSLKGERYASGRDYEVTLIKLLVDIRKIVATTPLRHKD